MSVILTAQKVGGGSADWQTPPELFERLNRRYRFNYDAFASHENALLPLWSTAGGTFFTRKTDGILAELSGFGADGLTYNWGGHRVFMNPPFTRGFIEQAVEKAYNERENAEIIVAILPAATETRWFQNFILPHCDITWLPRRVRFINPETGEPGDSPTIGHVIAVFKSELLP